MTTTRPTSNPALRSAAAAAFLAFLAGCAVAGPPAAPEPAQSVPAEPDAAAASFLDGSLDGSGAPAGLEELAMGPKSAPESVPASASDRDDGRAGRPPAEPLPFDEEIRAQFGGLFVESEADVPVEVLDRVAEYVEQFHAGRARENFERWLAREGRYRDLILDELRHAGLPEELLYLAMLESGFNPTAVSRAHAVGLWQFMRATGRESGLRIDDWVDERRDPLAATHAAVGHLAVLYDELGDWPLAAAAYNAGLSRVRRARRDDQDDYFRMAADGRLPAETRNYVPLILAAGHVARHRDRYGLDSVRAEPPLRFDTVHVRGRTRLSAVARVSGVPVDELRVLNAHLIRGAAPPGDAYPLRVPPGTRVAGLETGLAALPLEERILPEYREVAVTVEAGDSWWRIAHGHGTTVAAVRALNPRMRDVIHPGDRVVVARHLVTDAELEAGDRHTVAAGETMSGLAVRYGVTLQQLTKWNGMSRPRPLRIGERLVVAAPAAAP